MRITDLQPAPILRPYIRAFKIVESREAIENRVLPNTDMTLAFRCRGYNAYHAATAATGLPGIVFSGLRKTSRLIHYAPGTLTLIVLFRPGGAAAFFREPLHELFEQSIPLDSMIHARETAMVEAQLQGAIDDTQRAAIVEAFLLRRFAGASRDELVQAAIAAIREAKGSITVKELAASLYISTDAFEKRFRRQTGASPKQFAAIERLSGIVHQRPRQRLLDIALDAGYYDQAHFNKDFKLFTGQTPAAFFASPSFW